MPSFASLRRKTLQKIGAFKRETERHVDPESEKLAHELKRTRKAEAPIVPFSKSRQAIAVTMGIIVDLPDQDIEKLAPIFLEQQDNANLVTVLITNSQNFELFRRMRLVFEYLPSEPSAQRFLPDANWTLYRLRRLDIFRRKWSPSRIVTFGTSARDLASDWRQHSAEPELLKLLMPASQRP